MRRYYCFNAIYGLLAVLVFMCGFNPLPASADIYQWKDASGKLHFSDKKPAKGATLVNTTPVNSIPTVEVTDRPVTAPAKTAQSVVMYSTQRCGYCKKARAYFKQAGIAYREYDIDASESARRRYDSFGAHGVPLIFVGKARMNGFSEQHFNSLYRPPASNQ